MNIDEAVTLLRRANQWRRGAEIPQPNPHLLGVAIDTVLAEVERLRAQTAQPAVPDGYALVEIGVLSERCLDAAIKDAGIAQNMCADLDVVLSAGIHAYLLAAAPKKEAP